MLLTTFHGLWPIIAALILLFFLSAAAAIAKKLHTKEGKPALTDNTRYQAEPSLLTPAERSFFGVLQLALGAEHYICPKVRLSDIITPAEQTSRSGWQAAFNRIASKHVDFAICVPADMSVCGVVELDDRTHKQFERGFRDDFLDGALSGAGIQVIRVPAQSTYSQSALRDQILKSLKETKQVKSSANSLRSC